MNSNKKQKNNIVLALGIILIAGAFFSYQPVFYLGKSAGANLEISLTQIAIVLFIVAIASFAVFSRRLSLLRALFKPTKTAIPLYCLLFLSLLSTVSLIWTENLTRGALTTILLWSITALWIALQLYARKLNISRITTLTRFFFIIAIGISLFGWYQLFGDALGLNAAATLLPETYRSQVFGFARPTGFSLEPQFFGSILLIPIIFGLYLEIRSRATILSRLALFASATVFFATISRGAYLGLGAGVITLFGSYLIFARSKQAFIGVARAFGFLIGSLIVALGLCAAAATINTRDNIDGKTALIMTINQLSIGTLNIPLPNATTNAAQDVVVTNPTDTTVSTTPSNDTGYVSESTDSRLLMVESAFDLWTQSPQTILFGIGAGGFGASLHNKDPMFSLSSIVNNQYLEILTEVGLIGFITFIAIIFWLLILSIVKRYWLGTALIVAISVQWLFFSGNINVLHIWIVFALIASSLSQPLPYFKKKIASPKTR